MDALLVTPPHYFLYPSLSVPRLVGYLQGKGFNVDQIESDSELYDYVFSENKLKYYFDIVHKKYEEDKNIEQLFKKYLHRWHSIDVSYDDVVRAECERLLPKSSSLADVLRNKEILIRHIIEGHASMKQKYLSVDACTFLKEFKFLELGTLIISLAYYPTVFDLLEGIIMKYSFHSAHQIEEALSDSAENFLLAFYKEIIVPKIRSSNTQLVGVSITHPTEFIPAFTLLKLIREECPEMHITIGGALVTYIYKDLIKNHSLWSYYDSMTIGLGEYSLASLITQLKNKGDLEQVPDLAFKKNGTVVLSSKRQEVDLNNLATPVFAGLRPSPIIPLNTSFGCDWGKCQFCAYPFGFNITEMEKKPCYRIRNLDKVVEDIQILQEEYHPSYFGFTDSDIPPRRLEQLADKLIQRDLKINMVALTRISHEYYSVDLCKKLARAGLSAVFFGLETGSVRVNALMKKNVELEHVERVLKNFNEAGIVINMFFMVGFPTETVEEAMMTRDFILKHKQYIDGEISIAPFRFGIGIPLVKDPAGIPVTIIKPDHDFTTDYDYSIDVGMSQQESLQVYKKIYQECGAEYIRLRLLLHILEKRDSHGT